MTEQKRKTYCRACGENKGHDLPHCKNFTAMRKIIKSQDEECHGYIERAQTAENHMKSLEVIKAQNALLTRLLCSLLDLAEAHRATAGGNVK